MTAPSKAIDGTADLPALMTDLAAQARAAARVLALAPPEQKDRALEAIERAIRANAAKILAANAEDVAEVRAGGATSAFIDRLTLTPARIDSMADGVATVRGIPDPVGAVTESWQRPNGMTIERVRVPLGVIGVIFESRPNVAADAGVLCLKSGNAVILRGGSDSFRSCRAIHDCLVQGLREAGLPEAAITLVPTRDRAAVGLLLTGLNGGVDVIVPRGGKSLVARVEAEARVPVFAHLEGVNHVYVDRVANLEMAKKIVLNAKMRRPGVCGAAETLLVDRAGAATNLKPLVEMLIDAGCEVRGDDAVQKIDTRVKPASDEDWDTEYEDAIISARVVDGVDEAIAHIHNHGSHHTDAIVTEDAGAAREIPQRGRFRDRAAQRIDAVRRRRRVRLRRGDRDCHRQIPRPRPGRRRATDELQISRSRHRADAAVTINPARAVTRLMQLQSAAQAIPFHTNGMRIGLLGGSFNPPHAAHRAISLFAIKRLKLDRVWWLLTPGNPLKDTGRLHGLAERADAALRGRRRSAHRHQLSRSCHRYQVHCRHDHSFAPPRFRRALRLDHGRRQSRAVPSLEELAAHRFRGADRRDRPSAAEFPGACRPGRTGAGALSRCPRIRRPG